MLAQISSAQPSKPHLFSHQKPSEEGGIVTTTAQKILSVDGNFFVPQLKKVKGAWKALPSANIDESKAILFQEDLVENSLIRFSCPPPGNLSPDEIKNMAGQLGLEIAENRDASILCDITTIVPQRITRAALKRISPAAQIDRDGKVFLPCLRKKQYSTPPLLQEEKVAQELFKMNLFSRDIENLILSYQEIAPETLQRPEFYRYKRTVTPPKDSLPINEEASRVVKTILDNYHGDENEPLVFPDYIARMRNDVTKLDLFNTQFPPHVLDQLATFFPKIKELHLRAYDNADGAIEHLGKFTNLESLDLSQTQVHDEILKKLPAALRALKLNFCENITEEGLKNLFHLPLEDLEVRQTNITGTSFKSLPSTLRNLDCTSCNNITNQTLANLSEIPLSKLEIIYCPGIDGSQFDKLPKTLQSLDCGDNHGLKEIAMALLPPELKYLAISRTNISGTYFAKLPKKLAVLNCRYCEQLQDSSLAALESSKLTHLDIEGTKIKGDYFGKLPSSLQTLDCSDCKNLTDENLGTLVTPNLTTLDLSHTNIEGTSFDKLSTSLQTLECYGCKWLQEEAMDKLAHLTTLFELGISFTPITGTGFKNLPLSIMTLTHLLCPLTPEAENILKERQWEQN